MLNITRETELRHLNSNNRRKIEELLNSGDSWKELVAVIPKSNTSENLKSDKINNLLISNRNYQILEQQKYSNFNSPGKIFFDFWSTYGKIRPTLEDLIIYSKRSNLNRLTKYLIVDILNEELDLSQKSLDSIDKLNSDSNSINLIENSIFVEDETKNQTLSNNIFRILSQNECEIEIFNYKEITTYTDNFNKLKFKIGGRKLGEGSFGEVYLATIACNKLPSLNGKIKSKEENYCLAVKVIKNEFKTQFLNELKLLLTFKHEHLLTILGISFNQEKLCLIFEYIKNGSLQECLEKSCKNFISYENRIKIIGQIIEGIFYLHSSKEKPLVHRDIKSSNVLLTENYDVKICDFGLSKLVTLDKTMNSINIIGTSIYMAPEAFKGDISVELDIFSFGVVLFEILTGLPPISDENESIDILSYIQENIFEDSDDETNETDFTYKLNQYLDKKAGKWNLSVANKLFNLAKECTNNRKKKRPTIKKVKDEYLKII